jgi:hypothetical protein
MGRAISACARRSRCSRALSPATCRPRHSSCACAQPSLQGQAQRTARGATSAGEELNLVDRNAGQMAARGAKAGAPRGAASWFQRRVRARRRACHREEPRARPRQHTQRCSLHCSLYAPPRPPPQHERSLQLHSVNHIVGTLELNGEISSGRRHRCCRGRGRMCIIL